MVSFREIASRDPTHPIFFFFELFHEPAWWWTGAARTGRLDFSGNHRHDDTAAG
tara:strand:- start:249 stop:410 length:162 start_codon:yes stop_codon:yes gene_type:complete